MYAGMIVYACMHVYAYVYVYVHACMHGCMYVCTYVCMDEWMYMCIHVNTLPYKQAIQKRDKTLSPEA